MKLNIVYWTGSGNTQIIAECIQDTLDDLGFDCKTHYVSDVEASDVSDSDLLFLGCPSMSGENVEEYEFRPFLDELKPLLENKRVVLFGSYDWGDREWMVSWVEEMKESSIEVVETFPIRWEPTEEDLENVRNKVKEIVS